MEDQYGNNNNNSEENNHSNSSSNYNPVPPEIPVPPTGDKYNSEYDDIPPLKPTNWLWQSIIATILCCIPFGIVGIIFASRVDSLYYNQRYQEAEISARKAKMWALLAFGAGFLYLIIWIILMASGNMPGYIENIIENNASGYNF